MKSTPKKIAVRILIVVLVAALVVAIFCVFFDEAFITRKGTIYRVHESAKVVALTFDDGPSPVWTPQILNALKRAHVKATFFMLGKHVEEYPDIARRVVAEGHEIGNHTYDHHVLLFYRHRSDCRRKYGTARRQSETSRASPPRTSGRPRHGSRSREERRSRNGIQDRPLVAELQGLGDV